MRKDCTTFATGEQFKDCNIKSLQASYSFSVHHIGINFLVLTAPTIPTNLVSLCRMRAISGLKALKYIIYHSNMSVSNFDKTCGCYGFIWNKMLDEKPNPYDSRNRIPRITISYYKEGMMFFKKVDSLAFYNTQLQIQKSFSAYAGGG
jgi:hypothetical protein